MHSLHDIYEDTIAQLKDRKVVLSNPKGVTPTLRGYHIFIDIRTIRLHFEKLRLRKQLNKIYISTKERKRLNSKIVYTINHATVVTLYSNIQHANSTVFIDCTTL